MRKKTDSMDKERTVTEAEFMHSVFLKEMLAQQKMYEVLKREESPFRFFTDTILDS